MFSAFLLIVTITLGFILTKQSVSVMRTLIESRMLDVSNTAAAMLDGDSLERFTAEDTDTPAYQNAYKTLACFEENIELEYIYCVRALDDGSFVFMIDPDPEAPGAFGEHIVYTDALYQASQGTPSVDKVPFQDKWGRFYSAFSPVFDSKHQVAGIVGVDFSADWYDQQASAQLKTTLLVSGISLLFCAIIIVLFTTRLREHFRHMISEMNQVSDGIETLVHEISPGIDIKLSKRDPSVSYDDAVTQLGETIRSLEDQLSEQITLVRSQAYVDVLTGLSNRAVYEDRVNALNEAIQAGSAAFALAVFDMNGLKSINDRFGHDRGDQAIRAAAAALAQSFTGVPIYRIGGDEFTVILEDDWSDLPSRLHSVDKCLSQTPEISLSSGYAVFDAETDADFRSVFMRADNAMYKAKKEYHMTHTA